MQNKQAVLGLLAAAVILIGAGAVFTLNKSKNPEPNKTVAKPAPTNALTQNSIVGILESNSNKKCEFDTKIKDGETKGTVFVSGQNAYGTFQMLGTEKTQDMSMIRNGDTFYIWGSGLPQGIKVNMSVGQLADQMKSSQYSNLDPSQKTNFACSDWTADPSLFVPPSSMKFLNMEAMSVPTVKAKPTGVTSTAPSNSCSLCNSMTGEAKQTCLSGLHCK